MKHSKLIVSGAIILISLLTIVAVITGSSIYRAETLTETPGTETSLVTPCPIGVVGVEGAASLTVDPGCDPIPNCPESFPPEDVPAAVTTARNKADTTAAGTKPEVDAIRDATQADIENGSVAAAYKEGSLQVYNSVTEARTKLKVVFDTKVVPSIQSQYYDKTWTKVSLRTTLSSKDAESFFDTGYSRDPNHWGPQVSFTTTFYQDGNAALTARTKLGGFTYNGQQLDAGFAETRLTGIWKILGDRLFGAAEYNCNIGDAKGSTNVNGKWGFVGIRSYVPAKIKIGGTIISVTFTFGYNFLDKSFEKPGGKNWQF